MINFNISGRVVGTNGAPAVNATVTVLEVVDLTTTPRTKGTPVQTDAEGRYTVSWAETAQPNFPWDLFVRASDGTDTVDSALVSDLEGMARVDLILGSGEYQGRAEWDRIAAKLAPHLGGTAPKDIPIDRIEWLTRRADVFPLHLGAYIQAHRLAEGRTVDPQTCYALIRIGHPADLASLLRLGERAWEDALRNTWQRRILPLPGDGSAAARDAKVAAEIAALRELVVEATLIVPTTGVNERTLFDTAGLSIADQRTFSETWVAHSGSLPQFWTDVTTALGGDTAKVASFRFTIQASRLVARHVSTLTGLQAERGAGTIAEIRDLAAWSVGDWDGFLTARSVDVPDDVPGDTATAKRQTYARALQRIFEDNFPTLSLRHAIDRDEQAASAPANTAHLVTFFSNNPDFDVTRSTVAHYLSTATNPWQGIAAGDQAAARANLELVQRVYRLVPRIGRYGTAKVLLDQGIGSAAQIVASTREEFVDRYASMLPSDDHDTLALAGRIWDHATKTHSSAIAIASQFSLARSAADPVPVDMDGSKVFVGATNGLEALSTILGNLDYCACEPCRSVFGPAAYLADLLQFLADRPAKQAANALEALSQRRPDLRHILLDCGNTDTVLPYIDLVNELLERQFAGTLDASSLQTSWTAEELRLHPEHLDAAVYDGTTSPAITELVQPWTLPFALPTVEARTYLTHLGVPRAELMRALAPASPSASFSLTLAGEQLGLSATQAQIVAGTFADNASSDDREYWGFAAGAATDNWVERLGGFVGDFGLLLERGDLSLEQFREHLALDFINPSGDMALQWAETCALGDASVAFLDAPALDRLHRFVRLQRASAIEPRMLNVLLVDALGGTLNASTLGQLADITRVQARLRLRWDELATFWSTVIDPRSYLDGPRSLYDRRVRPRDLDIPTDFNLGPSGDTLVGAGTPGNTLSAHLPTVLAALAINEREFSRLIASELAGDAFSFANLTALFRSVTLARALGLRIDELVTLAGASTGLTGADPFASPAATLAFIELVDGLRQSGLSTAELDWLLRHEGEAPFDDEQTGRELSSLARGLTTVVEETQQLEDTGPDALATNLGELLTPAGVTEILAIVDRTTALSVVDQQAAIDNELGSYLDVALAQTVLTDSASPDYIEPVPLRQAWLLRRVVSYQRRRALVVDAITERFELAAEVAEALAFGVLTQAGTTIPLGALLLEPFANEAQIAAVLTASSHPEHFAAWTKLAKAARLVIAYNLRADEVRWYSGRGGWLDLNGLPLQTSDTDASFAAWDRLRRALSLRSLFPSGELTHRDIVDATSFSDAIARFAAGPEWDGPALETVAAALGISQVSELESEQPLLRLRAVGEAAARIGVGPDLLLGWIVEEPATATANAIKSAARSKYDEDQWARVAPPLRDAIRERQRDALVDAVIATQVGLNSREQVYAHLLIDVDMSACMMTSRIKQAISSVQLYIQRAFLQLESGEVELGHEAAERWEWMKNYRVWEANRKVFLYPENWLEPELRRGKTPEFERLEAALMQGTLDEDRVERAVGEYLEGLDRVSTLEIMGVYERHPGSEVWLLGRTAAAPHKWFVRQRASGLWGAWEEVPHKIDAEAVALVTEYTRVHLFWLNSSPAGENNQTYRISHSMRETDGWSPIATSDSSDNQQDLPKNFKLLTLSTAPQITIAVISQHDDSSETTLSTVFRYDKIDGKIKWLGSDPEETPGLLLGTVAKITSNNIIALQPGYRLDSQRYTNLTFTATSWSPSSFADQDSSPEPTGTYFEQGNYRSHLFNKRSSPDIPPSLIHQSNTWITSDDDPMLMPVAYDDGPRKYLLEPTAKVTIPGPDTNGPHPDHTNQSSVHKYHTFSANSAPTALAHAPDWQQALKTFDSIQESSTYSLGVPGTISTTYSGIELWSQGELSNEDLLTEAIALANAGGDTGGVQQQFETSPQEFKLTLTTLHHPYTRLMREQLVSRGTAGLYAPLAKSSLFRQSATSNPFAPEVLGINNDIVAQTPPNEEFDFSYDTPYGAYNWEIFYHTPLTIAGKLSTEQRFEDAQRWHHFIFNPIELIPDESGSSKYWRIRPFVEQAQQASQDQLEVMLGIGASLAEQNAAISAFSKQVDAWLKNPFDPHAIARIRPGVLQRALLQKYFDNLIAWADHLFRRDSIESINEATLLYVLVSELLGPRPQNIPGPDLSAQSYDQLAAQGLDAFTNALIEIENYIIVPGSTLEKIGGESGNLRDPWVRIPVVSRFWYFCYPPNPELLAYWDTVDDRLWKIRNCRNIEGVERQLPLFQPPIDPGLLVRATAAGVDIQSVLAELDSGLPPYRFRSVYARATAFTSSLRALGNELLSALEKRDTEQLARLRSDHEVDMLERVRGVREQQIAEARAAVASLTAARRTAEDRRDHFVGLIGQGPGDDLSEREEAHFELARMAHIWRQSAGAAGSLGALLGAFPQLSIADAEFGGMHLSNITSSVTSALTFVATSYDFQANKAQIQAGHQRRREDWELQREQANLEIARIERDIIAAEIRVEIAELELKNHDRQTEQAREVDRFMRSKFSNRELYDWMVGQLSTLYFQTYQLAFDLAKRAERAYRHELAISDGDPIIKYGYWDSLRRGLLAGERLQHDLERLDLAYMDRDIREFELNRRISLAGLAPAQLRALQETGTCSIDLPELLFDLDHPGHYLRRIRAVRLSIPAVVGPYTSLGARLQLEQHRTRLDPNPGADYADDTVPGRFLIGYGGGEAIATSNAISDGGVFNLDFRDERYLPFEYSGVVSQWTLTLPDKVRSFDYRTITDVVVELDYTARDGGSGLRQAAESHAHEILVAAAQTMELKQLLAVHSAMPYEWERFLAAADAGAQVLELPVTLEMFDHLAQRQGVTIRQLELALLLEPDVTAGGDLALTPSIGTGPVTLTQGVNDAFMVGSLGSLNEAPGTWTLSLADDAAPTGIKAGTRLDRSKVAGLLLVIHYTLNS